VNVLLLQFTAPFGSGSNISLQVAVGDRFSPPFLVTYTNPAFALLNYIRLLKGSKNETVQLQLQGSSFGFACSSCLVDGVANSSALPICGSPRSSLSCSRLACGTPAIPVRTCGAPALPHVRRVANFSVFVSHRLSPSGMRTSPPAAFRRVFPDHRAPTAR